MQNCQIWDVKRRMMTNIHQRTIYTSMDVLSGSPPHGNPMQSYEAEEAVCAGNTRSILFYVYTRYPHRSLVDIDNLSDKVMWNGLENRWLFLIFNQERILKVA